MATLTVVKESRYIMSDIEANNNKFWNILLYDDNTVVTQWGRVGETGQSKSFPHPDRSKAEKFYSSKCNEKAKKGYNESKVLSGTIEVKTVQPRNLAEVAKKQIVTNSPVVLNLVEYLSKVNVHQILGATTMSYDTSKGTFSTPLGVVTQDALSEARTLLTNLGNFVQKQNYSDPEFIRTANLYLMRIPRDIGRGKPDLRDLYPNLNAIQDQNSILDALDASLQMVMSSDKNDTTPEQKVFEAKMHYVEDGKVIDEIRKKYRSTLHGGHACAHLDVETVYEIEISNMLRAYEKDGKKLGTIWQLWHGTQAGNCLSILKSGYYVPPSNAAHVTGRMFGNGVYFSDQSTKSLNYAYGYWGGKTDNHCFMFLNDVAMGKFYVPKRSTSDLPMRGYDSTFAKAGESGVQNNEMIVYKTCQINPRYLIRFAPKGRK